MEIFCNSEKCHPGYILLCQKWMSKEETVDFEIIFSDGVTFSFAFPLMLYLRRVVRVKSSCFVSLDSYVPKVRDIGAVFHCFTQTLVIHISGILQCL